MYFTASLVPRDLIIEADSQKDFEEKCKRITIEHLVFSSKQISEKDYKNEMKERHVFLK